MTRASLAVGVRDHSALRPAMVTGVTVTSAAMPALLPSASSRLRRSATSGGRGLAARA